MDTTANNVDNIHAGTLFNANNTLPDSCLVARPVVPPPPPPPTGGGGTTPGTGGGTGTTKKTTPATTNPAAPADANVASGTLSAIATIPANGAKSAYLQFGTSPENLSDSSDSVTFVGSTANTTLSNLQAKTTYYYQVVRTASNGSVSSSANGTFTTTGYAVTLHFIDKDNKPVKGIDGVIDDADVTQTKSDTNGDLKFYDLDAGSYTVKYLYNKLSYKQDFNTDSISDDDLSSGKTVVLKDTVNVSTLKNGSTAALPTKKHSSVLKVVLWLLFLLLMGGAIVWLLIRRRRMQELNALYGGGGSSVYVGGEPGAIDMPTEEAVQLPPPPQVINAPVAPPVTPPSASGPEASHAGESLRDMVLRSMHEEALKRGDQGHTPNVPGAKKPG
jgi:hypothetical protein